jgi:high-affinity iron transporter
MLGTFVITWRETIEAALIVGILLTYLDKIGQSSQFRMVYWGVVWAVAAAAVFAGLSTYAASLFQDTGQEIFSAAILFLATVVLTHMVVWMHHNAREIKGALQHRAELAIAKRQLWALATLAFVGVFREGVETVLFLWGLFLQGATGESVGLAVTGGFLGVAVGILMTWAFFKGFGHLDLKPFFRVSGVILIFMAAGMLATGFGHLIAAGLLPGIIEPLWDTSSLLSERSLLGSLAAGIFGYRSHPSLVEAGSYLLYFPVVFGVLEIQRRLHVPTAARGRRGVAEGVDSTPES